MWSSFQKGHCSRTQQLNPTMICITKSLHIVIAKSVASLGTPEALQLSDRSTIDGRCYKRTLRQDNERQVHDYRPVKQILAQYTIPFICPHVPLFSPLLRTFAACTFLIVSGGPSRRHLQMSSEIIFPVTSRCDCMKEFIAAFRNLHAPFPGRWWLDSVCFNVNV